VCASLATVTAIETQKRHPDRVNIDLDGAYAFSLTGILAAELRVGLSLEPERIAALQSKDADESAYQQALRLLSHRERSEAEIRAHLHKRKMPEDVVERTLTRLRDHRHADDEQFARAWVENRNAFRPRGRRALAWELRQKGIPTDVAEASLSGLDESALAHQAGLKKARQLVPADWQVFRPKMSAYLARRGFPSSIIAPIVSALWTETRGGQPSLNEEDIP